MKHRSLGDALGPPCTVCGGIVCIIRGGVAKGTPYLTDRAQCVDCETQFIRDVERGLFTGTISLVPQEHVWHSLQSAWLAEMLFPVDERWTKRIETYRVAGVAAKKLRETS